MKNSAPGFDDLPAFIMKQCSNSVIDFLEDHNILYNKQFGFRK